MNSRKIIRLIVNIIIIIGSINWITYAFTDTKYISNFTGIYSKYVIVLIGLAGIYSTIVYLMEHFGLY